MRQSNRFVVISGCSSGGKSTLLTELGERGYATVEEPGRRIVKEELLNGGRALPWEDAVAFVQLCLLKTSSDTVMLLWGIREAVKTRGCAWLGDGSERSNVGFGSAPS